VSYLAVAHEDGFRIVVQRTVALVAGRNIEILDPEALFAGRTEKFLISPPVKSESLASARRTKHPSTSFLIFFENKKKPQEKNFPWLYVRKSY